MNGTDIPVIQTAGLTKIFKDFWRRNRVIAVNDLNMEIQRGEVFGLLGPNGSGKSTTIKMLLGLLYPTRGRISVFGKPPTDVAVKTRIGFLPEESFLYRFLNARETLDLYGRLFQLHGAQRADRIEKLLKMVGLQNEAKRRIGEYSKGMARRIGLAQALLNDPELLILDEPTAGLDPIGIRQIKDVVRDLAAKGKTILLSSHLLADVEDVCDHIAILYGGRQRASGTTSDLLSREDRTQFTTEQLTPELIARVRDLLEKNGDKKILSVGAPADRLETFFMKTIEQAEAANVRSSGARRSGEIADFLGTTQPASVIDTLVTAAHKTAASRVVESAQIPPEKPVEEPTKRLIEQLTQTPPDDPREIATVDDTHDLDTPPTPEPAAPRAIEGDRTVIDSLIRRKEDTDG